MKKLYVLGAFLLLLSIPVASADASSCAQGDRFSSSTGLPCAASCAPGDLYDSRTGQPCGGSSPYLPGCASLFGYSVTTGTKCDGALRQVVQSLVVPDAPQPLYSISVLPGYAGNVAPAGDLVGTLSGGSLGNGPELFITILKNGVPTKDLGLPGEALLTITNSSGQFKERDIYLTPQLVQTGYVTDQYGTRTQNSYYSIETGYQPDGDVSAQIGNSTTTVSLPALHISTQINVKIQ